MIFYRERKRLIRIVLDNYYYAKIIIQDFFIKPKDKVIFFDISNVDTNRYLYNLISFFLMDGHTVYFPKNKSLINKLRKINGEFKFASFLLNEGVKIGMPKKSNNALFFTKEQLSNDYFNTNYYCKDNYHVPMCQYPAMYSNLVIEENINFISKRKRSVFMAGNFNPLLYGDISKKGFFNILSRREIVDFVYAQANYHKLDSIDELIDFISNQLDFKVLLIDTTNDFQIKMQELKKFLKKFDFFMALPGVEIPQSHNLIEAMAMGCIPIIHKTYADLFNPPLQHNKTAIVYETTHDLEKVINEAFDLSEEKVLMLRQNILQYYQTFLTTKAIVQAIETNNYSKILIQAECISLSLLNKNK